VDQMVVDGRVPPSRCKVNPLPWRQWNWRAHRKHYLACSPATRACHTCFVNAIATNVWNHAFFQYHHLLQLASARVVRLDAIGTVFGQQLAMRPTVEHESILKVLGQPLQTYLMAHPTLKAFKSTDERDTNCYVCQKEVTPIQPLPFFPPGTITLDHLPTKGDSRSPPHTVTEEAVGQKPAKRRRRFAAKL